MVDRLPTEILQKIFFHLSPYSELDEVMMVCRRWRDVGKSVLHFRQTRYVACLEKQEMMSWHLVGPPDSLPKIHKVPMTNTTLPSQFPSKRFGASLIHCANYLYLFGGATAQQTAFNDLWSFNLTSKVWNRLVPSGVYPPPRACATGLKFHNNLLIYGGFELQPTSLHWLRNKWLNTAYVYNIPSNRWNNLLLHPSDQYLLKLKQRSNHKEQRPGEANIDLFDDVSLDPSSDSGYFDNETPSLPNSTGHSVCLLQRNRLILFGGSIASRRLLSDVYEICLGQGEWSKLSPAGAEQPQARFGHLSAALSETAMLIMGGDVGPNEHVTDVWMLQVDSIDSGKWWWSPIDLLSGPPPDLGPPSNLITGGPPIMKHLVCLKVPGAPLVVVLAPANSKLESYLSEQEKRASEEYSHMMDNDVPLAQVVDQEGNNQILPAIPHPRDRARDRPSIRPNAQANRQRQLEILRIIEEDYRRQRLQAQEENLKRQRVNPARIHTQRHPLCLYTLNVSQLLDPSITPKPSVWWTGVDPTCQNFCRAPSERAVFTAVFARQELFIMGGIVTTSGSQSNAVRRQSNGAADQLFSWLDRGRRHAEIPDQYNSLCELSDQLYSCTALFFSSANFGS